jgi:hypothetical protein
MGDRFPKHIYHSIVCICAQIVAWMRGVLGTFRPLEHRTSANGPSKP